ncbi:hypothetical protein MRX96_041344 [Rhipicephalus microplus]
MQGASTEAASTHFGSTVLQKLMEEFDSVAVDWKSFRNIKECPCSTPFDHFRRKFHCWSCGDVFCIQLTHTNSIDS